MQAWGIIMTVFTMFGMLVLTIASVTMDNGLDATAVQDAAESVAEPVDFKKAA